MPRNLRILAMSLITGCIAVLTIAGAGPACAHAVLESTSPAAGSSVGKAPTSVVLTFDEPPIGRYSAIHVTGPDGRRRDVGSATLSGASVTQKISGELPSGQYVVDWRVVSDDGHPVSGQFTYTIPQGTAGLSAVAPAPTSAATAATAPTSHGSSSSGWIIAAVVVIVLGVTGVGGLTLRRRRTAVHR